MVGSAFILQYLSNRSPLGGSKNPFVILHSRNPAIWRGEKIVKVTTARNVYNTLRFVLFFITNLLIITWQK